MYTTIKYFLSPSTQYIYKFLVNAMTEICLNFFAVSIKEILLVGARSAPTTIFCVVFVVLYTIGVGYKLNLGAVNGFPNPQTTR
jgi:hypothetical protein